MADKKTERRGLGRGLSALMADVSAETREENATAQSPVERSIPIEMIAPNPDQPRRDFPEGDMSELAASIREKGIIQPLIVRERTTKKGTYEIVAGERRWRAAQMAHLHEVPAILRDYSDIEVLEIAIIENVQRANLNPVEEAAGYRQLMDRFGHTQENLAQALGKSRSHIANLLRLLKLPDEVLALLREEKISAGHARALVATENPSELARLIVRKGLSVREAEKLAKSPKAGGKKAPRRPSEKDADTRALEADLSANLGMKVVLTHADGQQGGSLTVSYKSLEDLDNLCRALTRSPIGD